MFIILKNWSIIIFSLVLFSLISIGIAQAGIFKVKVYHAEYCPRQGAYVRIYNTSYPPKPPYNPIGFCFVTNEEGYCQTTAPMAPNWLYKANATWPTGIALYGENFFTTDENGNIEGIVTIRNSSWPYPQGTEACGGSECDGYKYCYGDGSKYIECDTWDTECDTLDCCQCNGGTQANPTENYDETQDEDCDPFNIATCFNVPDAYDFTWDYRDSYCTALDTCYQGTITHTCDQPNCGAECDEDPDCGDKCVGDFRYYSGICNLTSTCNCSYSTENCNSYDGCYPYEDGCEQRDYYCNSGGCLYNWENRNTDSYDSPELYCSANTIRNRTRFHDWYCNAYCTDHESWVNDHLEEDCDAYDDYYDTGNTRWVETDQCNEKEQKEQIWKEWLCNSTLPVHCSYYNTTTRWIDTGATRNKPNGTPCDDGLFCNVGETCQSGTCTGGSGRDCSDANECTNDICNEELDVCENPNLSPGTYCGLARDCPPDVCNGFFIEFYPDDGQDTCDGLGNCVEYSCAMEDSYCTDNVTSDGLNGLMCGAQCDQGGDCASGSCLASCLCEITTVECDLNGDCVVNYLDASTVAIAYGSAPVDDPETPWDETEYWYQIADIATTDGVYGTIDLFDLIHMMNNFGNRC